MGLGQTQVKINQSWCTSGEKHVLPRRGHVIGRSLRQHECHWVPIFNRWHELTFSLKEHCIKAHPLFTDVAELSSSQYSWDFRGFLIAIFSLKKSHFLQLQLLERPQDGIISYKILCVRPSEVSLGRVFLAVAIAASLYMSLRCLGLVPAARMPCSTWNFVIYEIYIYRGFLKWWYPQNHCFQY